MTGVTPACAGANLGQSSAGGPQVCVIRAQGLAISAGVTLRVEGDHPLVLLIEGDAVVNGTLDAAAQETQPGPGGGQGGQLTTATGGAPGSGPGGGNNCQCNSIDWDDCGGGGGGFGTVGGTGGQEAFGCTTLGTGGAIYGNLALKPLLAGSGGGSGYNMTNEGAQHPTGSGGAGGGAIQISAQQAINITGTINVGGGGGQGGDSAGGLTDRAAGGGGSGGAVLLEALQIMGAGWIAANGGGGGAGSDNSHTCGAGADGKPNDTVAQGGSAISGQCIGGGSGAAASAAASSGSSSGSSGGGGGGGGGGGRGRIRINWCQSCPTGYPKPAVKTSGETSYSAVLP